MAGLEFCSPDLRKLPHGQQLKVLRRTPAAPELPEVETTLRGIEPHVTGRTVTGLTVRQPILRYPIPEDLERMLVGQSVHSVRRRGKYLLFGLEDGSLIVHLGMSGSLRIVAGGTAPSPHDHVDIAFGDVLLP